MAHFPYHLVAVATLCGLIAQPVAAQTSQPVPESMDQPAEGAPMEPPQPMSQPMRQPPPAARQGPRGMFGVDLGLLGPASLFNVAAVIRPAKHVEVLIGIGSNQANESETTDSSTATAEGGITSYLARFRFLPMGRHSLLLEAGMGASDTQLEAAGTDTTGNSLTYKRSGMLLVTVVGVGYALRGYGGFRLSVLGGWRSVHSGMDDSTLTATGSSSETDRQELKRELDAISDGLAKSAAYLELGLGWAF